MRIRSLALPVLVAVLVSVAGWSRLPSSPRPAAVGTASDTLIVLERYHTLNARAAYVVRIEPGGIVRYDGQTSIGGRSRLGNRRVETDTLAPGATRRLVEAFEAVGFEALPDSLLGGRPPCGPTVTDGGLARTQLRLNGRTHEVLHELACPAPASADLHALEVAIDHAAGTARWTRERR